VLPHYPEPISLHTVYFAIGEKNRWAPKEQDAVILVRAWTAGEGAGLGRKLSSQRPPQDLPDGVLLDIGDLPVVVVEIDRY